MAAGRISKVSLFPETRHSLLDGMRAREESAWQLFFDLYSPIIYRLAVHRGLDPAAAEEVVADVLRNFVVAVRNGFEVDPSKGRLRAYLQTMTRNACTDRFRARGSKVSIDDAPEPAARDEDWERIEREEQLRACWQRLQKSGQIRKRDLQAFEAYALDGQPARAVAKKYEITVNRLYGVKHEVMRALGKVFAELENVMDDAPPREA